MVILTFQAICRFHLSCTPATRKGKLRDVKTRRLELQETWHKVLFTRFGSERRDKWDINSWLTLHNTDMFTFGMFPVLVLRRHKINLRIKQIDIAAKLWSCICKIRVSNFVFNYLLNETVNSSDDQWLTNLKECRRKWSWPNLWRYASTCLEKLKNSRKTIRKYYLRAEISFASILHIKLRKASNIRETISDQWKQNGGWKLFFCHRQYSLNHAVF
jgi:hypothetical protein